MLTHDNCISEEKKLYWIKTIPNVLKPSQISKGDVGTFGIPRKYCRSLHKTPTACLAIHKMAVIWCNPSPHLGCLTIRWQQNSAVSQRTTIFHRKEKLTIKGDKNT